MNIAKGIEIIGKGLWMKKSKTLIIADLHIGYEEALNKQGILVPRTQFKEMFSELNELIKQTKPETVVLNGDLKHEFGDISEQEWNETLKILDLLMKNSKVILVKGNHDTILGPIARKRGLKIVEKYEDDGICIIHGDNMIETATKTLIIGHEHPAISLKEGMKTEKYKCFLVGKWKKQKLIVMPSFFSIFEGTDIRKETVHSPFLEDVRNFEVFILGDKTYMFGKLKDIKVV